MHSSVHIMCVNFRILFGQVVYWLQKNNGGNKHQNEKTGTDVSSLWCLGSEWKFHLIWLWLLFQWHTRNYAETQTLYDYSNWIIRNAAAEEDWMKTSFDWTKEPKTKTLFGKWNANDSDTKQEKTMSSNPIYIFRLVKFFVHYSFQCNREFI